VTGLGTSCEELAGLQPGEGLIVVHLADGRQVGARAVVIATGARYRRLDLPGLASLEGTGVYYAATLEEASRHAGDAVAVVGGGNSAGQAAVFLAAHTRRVYLLVRRDLAATMSRYLIDQLACHPNVEVLTHTEVAALNGGGQLQGLTVADRRDGSRRDLDARALFVFIGADPHTQWLPGVWRSTAPASSSPAVTRPPPMSRQPGGCRWRPPSPGVFAAGDVRSGSIKRVASAVGESSMAVRLVHDHLARQLA
jgi:thioredoxin reductase (NADPH)